MNGTFGVLNGIWRNSPIPLCSIHWWRQNNVHWEHLGLCLCAFSFDNFALRLGWLFLAGDLDWDLVVDKGDFFMLTYSLTWARARGVVSFVLLVWQHLPSISIYHVCTYHKNYWRYNIGYCTVREDSATTSNDGRIVLWMDTNSSFGLNFWCIRIRNDKD